MHDENGQWIVLSGLTISLSLVAVAVLINQGAITGYYSSYAALEFPKDHIRELIAQTHETAKSAAQMAWQLNNTSNESVNSTFTVLLNNYSSQVSMLYAAHGENINITLSKSPDCLINPDFNATTHSIEKICLSINYNDGITKFISDPEIIEVEE